MSWLGLATLALVEVAVSWPDVAIAALNVIQVVILTYIAARSSLKGKDKW